MHLIHVMRFVSVECAIFSYAYIKNCKYRPEALDKILPGIPHPSLPLDASHKIIF